MTVERTQSEQRKRDPYRDQRSGEDRRQVHRLSYFSNGGIENRCAKERRAPEERRKGCQRVTRWSSVCAEALSNKPDDRR